MELSYNTIGIMHNMVVFRGNDISKINSAIACCKWKSVNSVASAMNALLEWSTDYTYSYYAWTEIFDTNGTFTKVFVFGD